MRKTVEQRFWEKVDKRAKDECWEWIAAISAYGYGRFLVNGINTLSHRFSYMLHYKKITEDVCVCHTCDNRKCVNPQHLFLGTRKDNNIDKKNKNRSWEPKGELNANRKLTEQQVIEIRNSKLSTKELSKLFKVSEVNINRIKNNSIWKHI